MALPKFALTGSVESLGVGARGQMAGAVVKLQPNIPWDTFLGVASDNELLLVRARDVAIGDDGTFSVELLANDDSLGLDVPLQWQVKVPGLPAWWFDAPARGETIDLRSTPRALPELYSSFAGKADCAAPTTFDSGQTLGLYQAPGQPAPAIEDGLLTAHPTGSGVTAYYYKGTLADTATQIGSRFVFSSGTSTKGAMALAICNTELGPMAPDMSCHFVISSTGWTFGVWAGPSHGNTGLDLLGGNAFTPALKSDGVTEHEAEAFIDGDAATLRLPDGTSTTITDSRIADATYGGPYVFFEQYAGAADTDEQVGFTHVWASSGPSEASQPS